MIRAVVLWALLAGAYAAAAAWGSAAAGWLIALPALGLAGECLLRGTGRGHVWAGGALLLSALGDLMGGQHLFLPQILFFAMAHGAYIAAFVRSASRRPLWRLAAIPVVVVAAAAVGARVVGSVADPVERVAVTAYVVIIAAMAAAAGVRGGRAWALGMAGAALFMLSDSLIAWNRFICRLPHATLWIMSSYYAAQLLLTLPWLGPVRRGRAE